MSRPVHVTVLGGGSWGTTVASLAATNTETLIWARNRFGLYLSQAAVAKFVWVGIGLILAVIGLATVTVVRHPVPFGMLIPTQELAAISPKYILRWLTGFALVLPVLGGGDALARAAHEFPPPRLKSLRRTSLFVSIFIFITLAFSSFLYVSIVPKQEAPHKLPPKESDAAKWTACTPP